MQVYKAFFKIILKNLGQIIIYVVVFITLAIALANTNSNPGNANFQETKINVAFINNDRESKLIEGLKNYIGQNANFIDIQDDSQKLKDALFFRQVEYIVRVPKGFTDAILKGETPSIDKTAVPGSTSEIFMDNMINKYLNTAKIYNSSLENLSEEQLVTFINKDLQQKTDVKMYTSVEEASKNERRAYYFNYMAYSLFAVLILGVCSVMIVFNDSDLKRRNLCSPVRLRSMNFQMIMGNISYAVLAWFVMILAAIFMYGSYMFTARGLLFLLNSLIFTMAALSISYLLGNVIKSRGAMSAAANVFSLGTCFISGVFVPQAFLGKTVLRIASFTPNYWYVKSNNAIANMVNFNMDNLAPIFLNMLVIVGFAVAVLTVTLVVIKQRRLSS